MKHRLTKIILTAPILAAVLFLTTPGWSQTYKPDWATKIVLAGGQNDPANPVRLLAPANAAGGINLTLPASLGTNGFVLKTDGSGVMSWVDIVSAINASSSIINVANGGTGVASLTAHGVVIGNGTSGVNVTSAGTAGQLLASGGASADPTWVTTVPIANGGTNGTATPTLGAIAYGTGTAYAFSAAGTSGQVLLSGGTGSPTWSDGAGNFIINGTGAQASSNFNISGTGKAATSFVAPLFNGADNGAGAGTAATFRAGNGTGAAGGNLVLASGSGTAAGTVAINYGSSTGLSISNAGVVALPAYSTNGVAHFTGANGTVGSSLIVNADVASNAAIDFSKLATLATGHIIAGNGGTATDVTVGGDATIGATGVLTVTKINGVTVNSTATDKNILIADGTQWNSVAASGDVTIAANTGTLHVDAVQTGAGSSIATAINSSSSNAINGDNIKTDATLKVTSNNLGVDLSHANTWTGTQTLQGVSLTSATVAITASPTNNLALGTTGTYFYLNPDAAHDLTGIAGGSNGRMLVLINKTANAVTIDHDATSTAANRFWLPGGENIILATDGTATFIYDGTAGGDGLGRWRMISAQ
ncbi:MAG: hypothetical protein Q8922_01020 [Bacteroidota bacterium]|nr:hypothetical protein [Bacteroidota bacterium]MDP4232615.1 hypothetical protein [Bacteroidota bacterium]MDP4286494.1 hypothetical protein [Bacteroidota bacterium]